MTRADRLRCVGGVADSEIRCIGQELTDTSFLPHPTALATPSTHEIPNTCYLSHGKAKVGVFA
jgi:hypothetical protein